MRTQVGSFGFTFLSVLLVEVMNAGTHVHIVISKSFLFVVSMATLKLFYINWLDQHFLVECIYCLAMQTIVCVLLEFCS